MEKKFKGAKNYPFH